MKKCIRVPTALPFSGLDPTDYISDEMLQEGQPEEQGKSVFADETRQLDVGVWECEPHRHVMTNCPYHEFVYLLEGCVDIIDEEGEVETYRAGDSFVMPLGCNCIWDVKESIRKLYVVVE